QQADAVGVAGVLTVGGGVVRLDGQLGEEGAHAAVLVEVDLKQVGVDDDAAALVDAVDRSVQGAEHQGVVAQGLADGAGRGGAVGEGGQVEELLAVASGGVLGCVVVVGL